LKTSNYRKILNNGGKKKREEGKRNTKTTRIAEWFYRD
jgi:hypothetical protein